MSFLLLFISELSHAQSGALRIKEKAFKAGEMLSYKVKYRVAGIWTKVGRIDFTTEKDTCTGRGLCYEFQGKGWTLPFYDPFFKVRDIYRSHATWQDLASALFSRKVREGGNIYSEYYRFDHEKGMFYRKGTTTKGVDSVPLPAHALDVLTAIYRCRSMDLEGLQKKERVPVDLILGKKVHSTDFIYRGKKNCKGPEGRTLDCHYIEPKLIEGSIFKEGDRMKVLVTDDARKLPVYVESEIVVGKVKVELMEMKGTIDP
ncbi:MAG: DUF3108 domain-containing protein [Flavobacteriales bacterium]